MQQRQRQQQQNFDDKFHCLQDQIYL